jgi:flagellar motor protein MotB
MRSAFFILLVSFLVSCVSSQKYADSQSTVKRLQTDSTLLEKRIHSLQDEVNHLATQSATMEQSLNQRLQEKQDSLIQKQEELKMKEGRINDMKARKIQEQEAFGKLSSGIIRSFAGYSTTDLVSRVSCAQTIIEVSDRLLFNPNTSKLNPEKSAKICASVADVLAKQPDLKLLVISHTDSVYLGKEKWEDIWAYGAAKSNAIVKMLTQTQGVAATRLTPGTQAAAIELTKQNMSLGRNRVYFCFYSELLPCIHAVE